MRTRWSWPLFLSFFVHDATAHAFLAACSGSIAPGMSAIRRERSRLGYGNERRNQQGRGYQAFA
eukprot:7357404-Lingulodinium_polyedra.AAC.1